MNPLPNRPLPPQFIVGNSLYGRPANQIHPINKIRPIVYPLKPRPIGIISPLNT